MGSERTAIVPDPPSAFGISPRVAGGEREWILAKIALHGNEWNRGPHQCKHALDESRADLVAGKAACRERLGPDLEEGVDIDQRLVEVQVALEHWL